MKSQPLKTMVLGILSLILFSRASIADCFIGPIMVEDDSYKGYEFTNNCADPATVFWRRTYKRDDGSQGSESGSVQVSPCSAKTWQYFQGDYTFGSVEVDQSKMCLPKDAKQPDDASNNGSPAGSLAQGSDLASRLAAQKAKNSTAADTRQKQDQEFKADVQSAKDRFQEQQLQQEQAAEQQREADLQAHQEEDEQQAEQAASESAMAKCNADHQQAEAKCAGLPMQRYKRDGMWVFPEGRSCLMAAGERFDNCKEALQPTEARVGKCREDYQGDMAVCAGNTDQFYKDGFPPEWVRLDSTACTVRASGKLTLCRELARGSSQSQIETARRLLSKEEADYKSLENSVSAWMPHPAAAMPSYAPSYGSAYVAPAQQGQSQQTQTAQSRPAQTIPFRPGPCRGDNTVCSGPISSHAPTPYVPPPQPRFIGPNAVR